MSKNLFNPQSIPGSSNPSPLFRYGIAVLAVICAGLAIHYLPVVGDWGRGALLLFFFANILVTLWLGLYPGLLSLVLSLIGINLLLLIPVWRSAPDDALFLNSGFCLLTSLIIALIHNFHRQNQVLRESQQDLSLAQEVAQVGSWRFKVKGDQLYWTDEKYRIFEIALGTKVTINTFFSAIHPEDREYVDRMWQACLGGEPYDIEHRIIVADDKVKWIREKAILEFAKDGTLVGGFGTTQDITERKKSAQNLQNLIDRYELVLEGAQDAIWDWDVVNKKVHYSSRWQALRGLTEDEAGNDETVWSNGIHPADKARVLAAIQNHFEGDASIFCEEYRIRRKDGTWMWILDRGIAKKDSSGQVIRMAGSESDITERKLAEQGMRESEVRIRLATEATGVGIWQWNIQTNQILWDDQMFSIFGLPPTKDMCVDYSTWSNAVLPEDLAKQEEILHETIRAAGHGFREYRIQRPDGQDIRTIEAVETVRTNAQGEVEWLIGTNLDITKRKNDELVLIEKENELRFIINSMPALIAYVDTEFRYVRVNEAYKQWLGIPLVNIVGQEIKTIIGEVALQVIKPYMEKAMAGEQVHYELEMPYKTAKSRWIHANYVPDKDGKGHVRGVVALIVDIGEIKQAEQKIAILNQTLQEHVEEMRAFLDTAPIGLCITTDLSAKVIRGNPTIEQMFGLPTDSELSLGNLFPPPVRAFVNGAEPPIVELPMQRAVRGKKVSNQLLDILRPDGKTITVLSNAVPLFNQHGDVRGAVGAFLDVTALKQAESALLSSEERLRLAKKSGNLGIFDQDLISGKMHWDKRLHELWGIEIGESIDTNACMARVHPDDRAKVYAAVKCSFIPEGGGEYQAEYRIIRKTDGKIFWLAAFGTTTFNNGRPFRLVGFVQDISERKLAEINLRDTETRLALAVKELNAGYWHWDLETNNVFFSPEWKQQLGYADNEVPNRYDEWERRIHPDDKEHVLKTVENHLTNYLPTYEIEFRLRHKNGSYRWIHSRAGLTHDENNQLTRMVGIHLDITDFKKTQELSLQRDKMEESFRLNIASQTVAAIAHDLNQPLIAISYFADVAVEMVKKGSKSPEKLVDILEGCSEQAQRAGQVIRQLMSVLQKGETQTELVDLNKMVAYAYEYINLNKELNSFSFEMNLYEELPKVMANTLQIQKILINIIHNSIDAMLLSGNRTGKITITSGINPNDPFMTMLTVSDTGKGVTDATMLNKMFQPFFTTKATGLGMGLSISRTLIEAYGGKMWAEQNDNIGISVHLTLPIAT